MSWLWLKALHIIFVVCWFAGIFYLPRLFVNHAMSDEPAVHKQLALMEAKLYRFTTGLAWFAVILGLILTWLGRDYLFTQPWFHAKLVLVLVLIGYHIQCGRLVRRFANQANKRDHVYYRWFNELPVFLLFAIVILVVVRPF